MKGKEWIVCSNMVFQKLKLLHSSVQVGIIVSNRFAKYEAFWCNEQHLTWRENKPQVFRPSRFWNSGKLFSIGGWDDRWDYYISRSCPGSAHKGPQPGPNVSKWAQKGEICKFQILMKMAPRNQKNSLISMVVFIPSFFAFEMSY